MADPRPGTAADGPDVALDDLDRRLLAQLQQDSSLSNLALAERVHASAATCLRRVRRLTESGLIERQVALVDPLRLAQALGHGLSAVVEVSLDRQDTPTLSAFEAVAVAQAEVQQCYRVSPGPDFVLVVHARDMPAYRELAERLFTPALHVRNVKAFFVTQRGKFVPALPVTAP